MEFKIVSFGLEIGTESAVNVSIVPINVICGSNKNCVGCRGFAGCEE